MPRYSREGLRAFASRFLSTAGRRGVAQIMGGTVLAQGAAILVSPVLTRLYTPENFGTFAVYVSLLTLTVAIATLRYELAIPLANDDRSALSVVALCLLLVATSSVLVLTALLLAGSELARLTQDWRMLQWALPVGLLGLGTYQTLSYWAVRGGQYSAIARTKVTQAFALIIAQIVVGLAYAGPVGLIVGEMGGRSAGIGRLSTGLFDGARRFPGAVTPDSVRSAAVRFRRFPLFSSWAGLLNVASLQIPAPMLLAIYGPKVAGFFALAQRVGLVPLSVAGEAVRQVYLGQAAGHVREGALDHLRALFARTTWSLALIVIAPAVTMAVIAPPLFAFVFGEQWRLAGEYLQPLTALMASQFIVNPVAHTLDLLQRQAWWPWIDGGRFVLVAGVFLLAADANLSPTEAILGYSLAMALSYGALHLLCRRALAQAAKR